MRMIHATKVSKRWALALLIGAAMQVSNQAQGQLVDAEISDAGEVVQAQAAVPQDQFAPPGLPQPQPLTGVDGQTVPPISQPFADPLGNQLGNQSADNFAPPPLAGPAPIAPGVGAAALGLSASLGTTAGSFSAAPTMIGDLFGGGVSIIGNIQDVRTEFFSAGTILTGSGNSSVIGFDFSGGTPNDIFNQSGTGQDISGDGDIDQFDILEPFPPTDAPTSPGPGFVFRGGTATYTNSPSSQQAADGVFADGESWFISYSYGLDGVGDANGNVIIAGPDAASRRSKLSENFSPEVRDRCFFNYSFFNDTFGGLGDVSRYVLGFERVLIDDLVSVEVRLPMAGTFSSRQQISSNGSRDFELGNATIIGKVVLFRSDNFTLTGGSGITAPLADDARLLNGERELLRIENEAVHILPFLGLLRRYDAKTFFQTYTQFDVDVQGNPVLANFSGGQLQGIGRFTDSTLAHVDASVHRIVHQNRQPSAMLKGVVANAELHYTGTLQGSDRVAGEGIAVSNLKENFNILNATVGAHLLLGKHVVVTPGMSVPIRDGLDEQFDYEAILQVNYLR